MDQYKSAATNLAHEGVPIRAIARGLSIPSSIIRTTLEEAYRTGVLVEIPREDWPPNQNRSERLPRVVGAGIDDDIILLNLVRLYKITPQQALLLLVLLKRREVTRDQMHQAIESRRVDAEAETDKKIVDVVVCKLRKRLRAFDLEIETVWAWGYAMPTAHRRKAIELLNAFMEHPTDVIRVSEV